MLPDLGKYAFAVMGSYLVAVVLLGGLIALSWWQRRSIKQQLAEAEARARREMSNGQ